MRIEEVHSTGDEDDYVYLVTVEGSGDAQVVGMGKERSEREAVGGTVGVDTCCRAARLSSGAGDSPHHERATSKRMECQVLA